MVESDKDVLSFIKDHKVYTFANIYLDYPSPCYHDVMANELWRGFGVSSDEHHLEFKGDGHETTNECNDDYFERIEIKFPL